MKGGRHIETVHRTRIYNDFFLKTGLRRSNYVCLVITCPVFKSTGFSLSHDRREAHSLICSGPTP